MGRVAMIVRMRVVVVVMMVVVCVTVAVRMVVHHLDSTPRQPGTTAHAAADGLEGHSPMG